MVNYAREVSLFSTDKAFMSEQEFLAIKNDPNAKAVLKKEGSLVTETRFWNYHSHCHFVLMMFQLCLGVGVSVFIALRIQQAWGLDFCPDEDGDVNETH